MTTVDLVKFSFVVEEKRQDRIHPTLHHHHHHHHCFLTSNGGISVAQNQINVLILNKMDFIKSLLYALPPLPMNDDHQSLIVMTNDDNDSHGDSFVLAFETS